jgi:hypothetical protein
MKKVITAVGLNIEVTTYNDADEVCSRPDPVKVGVLQSGIPGPVLEWLRELVQKTEG